MTGAATRRWWALGAISLAILAITLDVTVLTLALPTLAGALKASESELQWFVTAYTLALVAGMLPSGLLGDRYGRRALLIGALGLFAAGSLACAYAPGPEAFVAARIALGLAGAAVIVVALSVLTVLFSEEERPRAVGIWGAANFIGLPLGPIVGGWMLSHVWWGWIFLMNVPVALLALVAVLALVPESKAPEPPGIDIAGVALSSAGLVALMYGVIEAGDNGWGSTHAILPAVAGLAALAAFALWERRLAGREGGQPLVDLGLFRSRSFTWGVILTSFGAIGLFGVFFALPQYVQAVMGTDPQGAGFRMLPAILGLVAGALPADRIATRIGARLTVALGFATVVLGSAVGATMTASSGDGFLAAWTFVVGVGAGVGFATSASAALVELPAERAGVGSALLQAVVKLGPAVGASVLGSVLNETYQTRVAVGGLPAAAAAAVKASVFEGIAVAHQLGSATLLDSVRQAFVSGMDDAVRVAAGVAVAGLVLALLFLPNRSRAPQPAGAPRTEPERATAG